MSKNSADEASKDAGTGTGRNRGLEGTTDGLKDESGNIKDIIDLKTEESRAGSANECVQHSENDYSDEEDNDENEVSDEEVSGKVGVNNDEIYMGGVKDDGEDSDCNTDCDGDKVDSSNVSKVYHVKEENDGGGGKEDNRDTVEEDSNLSDSSDSERDEDGSITNAALKDEHGRELSAYEIMRLKRIERNKNYLARLGLEGDVKRKDGETSLLSPYVAKMKKSKRPRKLVSSEGGKEKRHSMSRRKTSKKIDYTEHSEHVSRNNLFSKGGDDGNTKPVEVNGDGKPKSTKSRPKQKGVPRFIYRELKRIESSRRQSVKTAEKYMRLAETEYRLAKKQADAFEKKKKRDEESIKTTQELKTLVPIVREIERRRFEIMKARDFFDAETKSKKLNKGKSKETDRKQVLSCAQERFPQAVKENERSLVFLLLERFPLSENCASGEEDLSQPRNDRKRKRKTEDREQNKTKKLFGGNGTANQILNSISDMNIFVDTKSSSPEDSTSPKSMKPLPPAVLRDDELLVKSPEKTMKRKKKVKNVGGPVSPDFADLLQRKWLEGDSPVAPNSSIQFVPQVGDTVLYYPRAHYDFITKHPDQRSSKTKLRKPLWQRASDEIEFSKKKSTDGLQENDTTRKVSKKPWWTQEWISSIQGDAGCYPVICRVERTLAEFPPEKVEKKKNKKSNVKEECGHSVKNEESSGSRTEITGRRPMKKKGSHIGLSVTLRPLTPIFPPKRIQTSPAGKIIFEDEVDSLPPNFSVYICPSELPQFLVPFAWAYRASLSLSNGDSVVKMHPKPVQRKKGSVISSGKLCGTSPTEASFDLFERIIRDDADADFSTVRNLDEFINKCYTENSFSSVNILPMDDLRIAIQVIAYQYHKWKAFHVAESNFKGSIDTSEKLVLLGESTENKSSPNISAANIINWVRMTLPRFNSAKVLWEGSNVECKISPWDLKITGSNWGRDTDNRKFMGGFADCNFVFTTSTSSNGGLIYKLDETLRAQLEANLIRFIETHDNVSAFVQPITNEVAEGYSWFVPVGMCLRRVLRRLKLQQMKVPRQIYLSPEDHTQQKSKENKRCCYYRSVASLLSDISHIFNNCLLYNDPESEIVTIAQEVTTQLKMIVEKLSSNRTMELIGNKTKESKQFQNGDLVCREASVANGRDRTVIGKLGSSVSAQLQSQKNDLLFTTSLLRDWVQDVYPDGSWMVNKVMNVLPPKSDTTEGDFRHKQNYWIPQCGDKIIYNCQLHKVFVRGHFSCLAENQRRVPPVLPSMNIHKNGLNNQTNNENGLLKPPSENENVDPNILQPWLLGTVLWTRAVFPSHLSYGATFDTLSPLLAICVQFHYNWLLKDVIVIYWRPCHLMKDISPNKNALGIIRADKSAESDKASNTECTHLQLSRAESSEIPSQQPKRECKSCGLFVDQSFIRPAWVGPMQKVHPPFPMSLARIEKPHGLPKEIELKLDKCLTILKERCINNVKPDAFDPKTIFNQTKYSTQLNIDSANLKNEFTFSDSEDEGKDSAKTCSDSKSFKTLCEMHFYPPWSVICNRENTKEVPRRNNGITDGSKKDDAPTPLHETILPAPNISMDLIHSRLLNGYYRSRLSIQHDVREAFGSTVTYLVKEHVGSRGITQMSGRRIAESLMPVSEIDSIKEYPSSMENNAKEKSSTRTKSEETSKNNSMAPCSPNHVKMNSSIHAFVPTKDLTNKEIALRKRIISVRKLYATFLVCISETPTAEIALGMDMDAFNATLDFGIEKERKEARRQVDFVLSAISRDNLSFRLPCPKPKPLPTVKVMVRFSDGESLPNTSQTDVSNNKCSNNTSKVSTDNEQYLNKGKSSSANQIYSEDDAKSRGSSNQTVLKIENKDDKNKEGEEYSSVEMQNTNEEIDVDLNKPIFFKPEEYDGNNRLIKALFCDKNRKHVCVRCKINKQSLSICRIRKAHSAVDYTLLNDVRKIGIDGMIRLLLSPQLPKDKLISYPVLQNMQMPTMKSVEMQVPSFGVTKTNMQPAIGVIGNGGNHPTLLGSDATYLQESSSKQKSVREGTEHQSGHDTFKEKPDGALNNGLVASGSKPNESSSIICLNESKATSKIVKENDEKRLCISESGESKRECVFMVDGPSVGSVPEDKPLPVVETVEAESTNHIEEIEGNPLKNNEDVAVTDYDPPAILKKAEIALQMAQEMLDSSTSIIKSEIRLSDDFVKACFPVDPTDGHYEICIVCGFGGDLLCCDSCPNVSHYRCAGLTKIPDGDWYCKKCSITQARTENDNLDEKETDGINQDGSGEVSSLPDLLEELKSLRPKKKKGDSNRGSKANKEDKNSKDDTSEQNGEFKKEEEDGEAEADDEGDNSDDKSDESEISEQASIGKTSNLHENGSIEDTDRGTPRKDDTVSINSENNIDVESVFSVPVVGTKIIKNFPEGNFEGEIIALPSDRAPFYKVHYEDGDEEELSEDEVLEYMHCFVKRKNFKSSRRKAVQGRMLNRTKERKSRKNLDKRGRKSIIKEGNSTRKRGRPRKLPQTEIDSTKRKRGRPRKLPQTETDSTERKRGRPRKLPQTGTDSTERKRGRPRKLPQTETDSTERKIGRPTKRGRSPSSDTSRNQGTAPRLSLTSSMNQPLPQLPSKLSLKPGSIDYNFNYYCAFENETCVSIAKKFGCKSWKDFAYLHENLKRYGPAMKKPKTRFKEGTFLRIPSIYNKEKVKGLIDDSSEKHGCRD